MNNSDDVILKELWSLFYDTVEKLCDRYNILLESHKNRDMIGCMHPKNIIDLANLSTELEWRDRKYQENLEKE